jgi:hypothetical protein
VIYPDGGIGIVPKASESLVSEALLQLDDSRGVSSEIVLMVKCLPLS